MLNKTSHTLTGMLLLLSLSVVSVPANAEPNKAQNENQSSEILLSQLLGHDTYKEGGEQKTFANYQIGTVRGQAGSIVSVTLEDGTRVNGQPVPYDPADDVGVTYEGKNVLVAEQDGQYVIMGLAHPPWITTLTSDYGLKLPEPESTSTTGGSSTDNAQ